jgi:hypothetical protein
MISRGSRLRTSGKMKLVEDSKGQSARYANVTSCKGNPAKNNSLCYGDNRAEISPLSWLVAPAGPRCSAVLFSRDVTVQSVEHYASSILEISRPAASDESLLYSSAGARAFWYHYARIPSPYHSTLRTVTREQPNYFS